MRRALCTEPLLTYCSALGFIVLGLGFRVLGFANAQGMLLAIDVALNNSNDLQMRRALCAGPLPTYCSALGFIVLGLGFWVWGFANVQGVFIAGSRLGAPAQPA